MTKRIVTVCHDESGRLWFVHASELPGLHAEASTLDELTAIIADAVPDLIGNLSGSDDASTEIPVYVQHRVLTTRKRAA